jgi:hypothetical protein
MIRLRLALGANLRSISMFKWTHSGNLYSRAKARSAASHA